MAHKQYIQRVGDNLYKHTMLVYAAAYTAVIFAVLHQVLPHDVIRVFGVNIAAVDIVSLTLAAMCVCAMILVRPGAYKRTDCVTVADIVAAISSGTLYTTLQPIYRINTGCIDGFEVVAEFNHPVKGIISNAEIVEVVNNAPSEISQQYTSFMIKEAASKYNGLFHRLGTQYQMTVNILANDLADATIISAVSRALIQHDMPFEYLTVEISEASLMRDVDTAVHVLAGLDSIDVRLALDDYGTHIVSFLRFSRGMWIDEIKVNSSLACNAKLTPHQSLMVAVLDTAREAGIAVTVTDVQTQEQYDVAVSMGVDRVQGAFVTSHLAKPDFSGIAYHAS